MNKIIKTLFVLTVILSSPFAHANAVSIIPQPAEMEVLDGHFLVPSLLTYRFTGECSREASYLREILQKEFNISSQYLAKSKIANVQLVINPEKESLMGEEGYWLSVSNTGINITAATSTGIFYGIQSLLQLIEKQENAYQIPFVLIKDKPRFPWRAFLLDEARSFKGTVAVKQLLDEMAALKMNIFQWHLTDDQGWRLQINRYPLLTEVGAAVKDTSLKGTIDHTFYTHEEVTKIVRYAAERHITIIPELEMPGHASAAIASYPWLGTEKISIGVPATFGIFDNIYNVADPAVISFIHHVLDEVMSLFPSGIIHIGGDEVKYDHWKNNDRIQVFMKKNNLATPAALQLWFTNGISQYLHKKGYRMMGWNEIMGGHVNADSNEAGIEQKLSPGTIIHFWLGNPNLINEAVMKGYDVVNSFHEYTYLDYDYKSISLEKAYSFDPVPASLAPQYHNKIIGSGCQMWGERIPTISRMNLQVFPRLAAYAEVGWTTVANKNFERFKKSLYPVIRHWEQDGIHIDMSTLL